MVRLEAVLDSWKGIRQDTALAVEEFPADDYEFRPTPELMSFHEISRHILGAGHALTGLMLDGEDDLSRPGIRAEFQRYIGQLPPHDKQADLAAVLRSEMEARYAELASKGADFYSGIITRFDGQKVTRLEMLQTVKEHELTHRSQLFLYLRLKGLVPAPTRRRQSKAQA